MPTYEYQCKKCGYIFEKFQSITAKPLKCCPKCEGEVNRLISKNGSFILKGSGYYSTDHRKSSLPKERKTASTLNEKNSHKNNHTPGTDKTVSKESTNV